MKKSLLMALTAGFAVITLLSGCAKKGPWLTDLDEAKKQAQRSNKNIYLLFSGDDWVEDSQSFKDNIANTDDFIKAMKKDYVLCNIDFSQNEYAKTSVADDATAEEKAEADRITAAYEVKTALAQKYNLYQYPSVFLLTKDEYVIASVPFDASITTPQDYLDNLKTYDEQVNAVVSLVKKISKSSGVEKAKAIDELYENTSENNQGYVSPWLDELIKEFPSLDPENETGNVARYQMDAAYAEAVAKAQEGDVDGASNTFVELCDTSTYLSDADRQTAYYTAAYILAALQSSDYDRMLELLNKAYEIDTESEIAGYLMNAIEGVKNMKTMAENYSDNTDDENMTMSLGEGETSE